MKICATSGSGYLTMGATICSSSSALKGRESAPRDGCAYTSQGAARASTRAIGTHRARTLVEVLDPTEVAGSSRPILSHPAALPQTGFVDLLAGDPVFRRLRRRARLLHA